MIFELTVSFRWCRYGKGDNKRLEKFAELLPQTVSAIKSFFLAMTLYPEVQKKAQAEIDTVIGADRLPSFEDRERLLYSKFDLKLLQTFLIGM